MLIQSFFYLRKYLPILALIGAFSFATIEPAFSAPKDGPEWLKGSKSTDTSKVDKGLKSGIDYALYFAIGLSVLGVAVGLAISTPIVGNRKAGIDVIKWSLIILAASSLFWLLIGIFLEMTGKS